MYAVGSIVYGGLTEGDIWLIWTENYALIGCINPNIFLIAALRVMYRSLHLRVERLTATKMEVSVKLGWRWESEEHRMGRRQKAPLNKEYRYPNAAYVSAASKTESLPKL